MAEPFYSDFDGDTIDDKLGRIPGKGILLLKLQSHLWEPEVEYDFRDGTYGMKFIGRLSSAPGDSKFVPFYALPENAIIRRAEGYVMYDRGVADSIPNCVYTFFPTRPEGGVDISMYNGIWGMMSGRLSTARTNQPYDVAVIYTKY